MSENSISYYCEKNKVIEFSFYSTKKYKDPFNEIELDVIFTNPEDKEYKIPAFWSGNNVWRVRFAPPATGEYKFISHCSLDSDDGLNKQEGKIIVSEYSGSNKLFKHGRLKTGKDSRFIRHEDGSPFFWLADTWWFALAKRTGWPEIFKIITEDRKRKGFTVIQLVAGRYPDFGKGLNKFEANEAGYIWNEDITSINPDYFEMADLKIFWLIQSGIVPCIAGSWGYHLPWMGIEKMKKHWRYLIARWAAYPVVWMVAGEANLQYYFTEKEKIEEAVNFQKEGWKEVTEFVKNLDPYKNPATLHPSPQPGNECFSSRDILKNPELFDIDIMQTSHHGKEILELTLEKVQKEIDSSPIKPVINGEVCYEGLMGTNWQETQRFLFWTHILKGCAGFSYGAEGIFEFRTEDENYIGDTGRWGTTLWDEALSFKGSYQIGLGKTFLENFEWDKFEQHPEWITPNWTEGNIYLPHCAGIPGKVKIIYFPALYNNKDIFKLNKTVIKDLDRNSSYHAYYFNPRDGKVLNKIDVNINEKGEWILQSLITPNPSMEDWVLVIEKNKGK
jgi:hypothetical protein